RSAIELNLDMSGRSPKWIQKSVLPLSASSASTSSAILFVGSWDSQEPIGSAFAVALTIPSPETASDPPAMVANHRLLRCRCSDTCSPLPRRELRARGPAPHDRRKARSLPEPSAVDNIGTT